MRVRQRPHPTRCAGHLLPFHGRRVCAPIFLLFAIVKKIIDAGGQFLSLAEPWADTSTGAGRLMIAMLGGLAAKGSLVIYLRYKPLIAFPMADNSFL